MTRKETLKNEIVMIGSGKSAPFYLLTEKMKDTKDINYESVTINSDGYGLVEVGIGQDEKIIGANIMTWSTGTLYGGPTLGNNGNGYGYILGKPNSVITNITIRWRIIKI